MYEDMYKNFPENAKLVKEIRVVGWESGLTTKGSEGTFYGWGNVLKLITVIAAKLYAFIKTSNSLKSLT